MDTPAMLPALITDADLIERVDLIVGEAHRSQVWLFLLDDEGVQLPALPVVELPSPLREHHVEELAATLSGILDHEVTDAIAVVCEIPRTSHHDCEVFPSMLAAAMTRLGGTLRAQIVMTRRGSTLWKAPARHG